MNLLTACLMLALSLTDAAFAGYRDACGRDATIFKDEYYRRALRRGLKHGFMVAVASLVWFALLLVALPHQESFAEQVDGLLVATRATLPVLGAYASVTLLALGAWAAAAPDLRSLASVVLLGPCTLLRAWVIVAAAAAGAWAAPNLSATLGVLGACGLQLTLTPWLNRGWRAGRRPV